MTAPEPMLAATIEPHQLDEVIESDIWTLEPKVDGHRTIVEFDGNGDTFGHTWRATTSTGLAVVLPHAIASGFTNKPLATRVMFDCELLDNTLVIFDLIEAGNQIGFHSPYSSRRKVLEAFLRTWDPSPAVRIMPIARTVDEKLDLIEKITAGRGEGLMAKRITAGYQPATRSPDWLKIKRTHVVDCVVDWLGEDIGTGKDNFGVACYDEHGNQVHVGECGRGTGHGRQVKVGDVVAITVLYVTDNNILYQPTRPLIRTDKLPEQCLLSDLAAFHTDKNLVLRLETS